MKSIIFDLGGVLLDIDVDLTFEEFESIIRPEFCPVREWNELYNMIVAMETGKWDVDFFVKYVKQFTRPNVESSQIIDAWCAMIHEFPVSRINLLAELSKRADLYLLSNTNILHIREFETDFLFRYGYSINNLFSKVFYSSEIGLRKPNADVFEYVMKQVGIKASDTLLIDDRRENCEAARSLGITAIEVPKNTGLEAVIDDVRTLI